MSLTLARRDLTRLEAAQEALLSPLDHETADEWCGAVLENVEELFRADRSIFVLPREGAVLSRSERPDSFIRAVLGEMMAEQLSDAPRYAYQAFKATGEGGCAAGPENWRNPMFEHINGISMCESEIRHGIVCRAGDGYGSGMNVSLPAGEAALCIAYSRPERDPFGEEVGRQVLRLLLPAFKTGVHAISSLQRRRASLGRVLDAIAGAVSVWDVNGRELHRSRKFEQLLDSDSDADLIMEEIRFLVGRLSVLQRPPGKADVFEPSSAGGREVSTAAASYQLRGGYLAAGLIGRDPAIAVAAERLTPELPPAEDLQERFDLTPREAEVARLLGRGLSNKEAAEQLFISPHTIRSHAERIFHKLGIHTRKALGLKLLGGGC